ncbi:MAG TPA: NrsF family protein [Polyangiaceae bacterium]|nr:NrsF family protein [Polyangiaceae bacterium]
MKHDFDLDRTADFPDPLAGIGELPVPLRPASPLVRPPTRSRVAALRASALGAALLYEGVWLAIFNKRSDLSALPRTTLAAEVAIPLAAAGLALAAATARGERGMGAPKGRLAAWVLLSPAVFVAATLFAGPPDVDIESFWRHVLRCFLVTGLLGLGPLGLAAWAFRRGFVAAPAWRMAGLGVACSAIAAASMTFLCSVGSPAHVLVGHGGLMVVAGLGGALFGRRLGEA